MGRSLHNVEEVKVRLPVGTRRRIEAVAGDDSVNEFIRDVVGHAIALREAEAESR